MAGKTDLPAAQRDRFIEAARQLGADEDEAAFKAKLAQIARQKPDAVSIPEGEQPRPPSVEQQLAEAETELDHFHSRFDAYNGNNPKKYQADIRRAAAKVKQLKARLG